ncbi:hypothetical protein [Streptomyces olivochromogenes]|uniref:hypothetical protein n=1 Tax=Streptomyces olivochromogenes TaxID=1963 RepID=UPI001F3D20E7|nr:hypothetical protein [Streptomyces olivochromogenes]MCF3131966.1 hypothetical protein [Streptomyces olivochromogenes]
MATDSRRAAIRSSTMPGSASGSSTSGSSRPSRFASDLRKGVGVRVAELVALEVLAGHGAMSAKAPSISRSAELNG